MDRAHIGVGDIAIPIYCVRHGHREGGPAVAAEGRLTVSEPDDSNAIDGDGGDVDRPTQAGGNGMVENVGRSVMV